MFRFISELFFPKVCAGCKNLLLGGELEICTLCRHKLPLTGFHLHPHNEAFNKFYGRVDITTACCFLYFHKRGIVQELIHALKYRGQQQLGAVLGQWYAEELKGCELFQDVHLVVPVPLHPAKERKRGYNQVTLFAQTIASELGLSFDHQILFRKLNAKTQSQKSLSERSQLADDSFGVRFDQAHHELHFLLIDDVLTTGATLEACAKAILGIPGAKVSLLTIAITDS